MKRSAGLLAATAVAALGALGTAGAASAAAPTGDYVNFAHCPYANPAVATCQYLKGTSGAFQLGKVVVPVSAAAPVLVQGGFGPEIYPSGTPWYDAVGADTLTKVRVKVPGGLLGLVGGGSLGGSLGARLHAAAASLNDVYATAELVGSVQIGLTQLGTGDRPGLTLPLRFHLENPFLGTGCYIGSASTPVTLLLQTGTTSPPPPNTPISGAIGTTEGNGDYTVLTTTGLRLVDNSFAVPAATSCGFLPAARPLITAALNRHAGLPSAAGRNAASVAGDAQLGDARATQASVH